MHAMGPRDAARGDVGSSMTGAGRAEAYTGLPIISAGRWRRPRSGKGQGWTAPVTLAALQFDCARDIEFEWCRLPDAGWDAAVVAMGGSAWLTGSTSRRGDDGATGGENPNRGQEIVMGPAQAPDRVVGDHRAGSRLPRGAAVSMAKWRELVSIGRRCLVGSWGAGVEQLSTRK